MRRPAYIKFLGADGSPCNGGSGKWSLPSADGKPGKWMADPRDRNGHPGPLIACERGYHVAKVPNDLLEWWGATAYAAEIRGKSIREGKKTVAAEVRLTWKLFWNDWLAVRFAADCAEHVLPIFERWAKGKDDRPRRAIKAARTYADALQKRDEWAAGAAGAAEAARAARAAEVDWQKKRLLEYLMGTAKPLWPPKKVKA